MDSRNTKRREETKRSKKILSIILLLIFSNSLLPYNLLYANNNGPTAPEAASFEPVDATDMVNLGTGDLSYVLPLLNIPSPEGGYPIALSYNAGIAMGQEASWVGLGWNLNPGAINRNVTGVPDDWKREKKFSAIYNKGGVSESFSGGVRVGFEGALSAGIYASYRTHNSVNGENSKRFDVGGSVTIGVGDKNSPYSITGQLGTDGIGISNALFELNQSFINGSTSLGISVAGTGMSLSSKNGLSVNFGSSSFNLNGSNSASNVTSINSKTLRAIVPFSPVTQFDFSYNKTKYWLYENNYSIFNGSLYAGDIAGSLADNVFDHKVAFDSHELMEDREISAIEAPNYTMIGYDNYTVMAQGLSGSISPYILQEGAVLGQYSAQYQDEHGYLKSDVIYQYPANEQFTNQVSNGSTNDIHFYFDNEISSFINVSSDQWNVPSSYSTHTSISDFQTQNKSFDSELTKDGIIYNGFNQAKNRIRKGSYIEVFTNQEIINSPSSIIPPNNFQRNVSTVPKDGIGAYRITALDGKVYHYSLPVYQRERFSRSAYLDDNIDDIFYEQEDLSPYATHWLLTAITGPDYFDTNSNGILDKDDYGYWVSMDYGKWSDGYIWRAPVSGYEVSSKSKTYEWGRKEVYYLDKMTTRSHTALFIKSVRKDNLSTPINIKNGTEPLKYPDTHHASFWKGDNNQWYFKGIFDDFDFGYINAYNYVKSEISFFVESKEQKSLKLDKIILLSNNKSSVDIAKTNSNQMAAKLLGEIYIGQKADLYHMTTGYQYSQSKDIHDVPAFYGEYYSKILDSEDLLNTPNIEAEALKTIEFDYDEAYPLAKNSPNSNASSKGKLTLSGISQKGKGSIQTIPPYKFAYNKPYIEYDNSRSDDWGYSEQDPAAWSLNEITTPVGGKIEITYEEDEYYREAAETSYVLNSNFLQARFQGQDVGSKYIEIQNDPNNSYSDNIDFRDYFESNKYTDIDVLFWNNPNGSNAHKIADIAKSCLVTYVSEDLLKIQLPSSGTSGKVRRDEDCNEPDWSHYSRFNGGDGVVQWGWKNESGIGDCTDPGDAKLKFRFKINSNKIELNNVGGGIRVQAITTSGATNNTLKKVYRYTDPRTGVSSGITSFAPSRKEKNVKYLSALPGPTVLYEYVTVENQNNQSELLSKTEYKFQVYQPMENTSSGFNLGDIVSFGKTQQASRTVTLDNKPTQLNFSKSILVDNSSSLGRMLSQKIYNKFDELLKSVNNYYYAPDDVQQGRTEETVSSYKLRVKENNNNTYYLSSSSRAKLPSVLSKTEISSSGLTETQYIDDYDFLTGMVIQNSFENSSGKKIRQSILPAFNHYPEMGSKVDNTLNKNMLSQSAGNISEIYSDGTWKKIGANIRTWKNDWNYFDYTGQSLLSNNFWRSSEKFVWNGDISSEGLYLNYSNKFDGFNWSIGAVQTNPKWVKTSEITIYDQFSKPLEQKDINGNFTSTKMGDGNSKIFSVCNAPYSGQFFSSAEDLISGTQFFSGQVYKGSTASISSISHSGQKALKVNVNVKAFAVKPLADNYKVSLWAYKGGGYNYSGTKVKAGGVTYSPALAETVHAGDWVQLNFHLNTISTGQEIYVYNSSGTGIYDDFRLFPKSSSLVSYVYNEWDELEYIFGENNLGVKYKYDSNGRLTEIYNEVGDLTGEPGGFKLAKQVKYNYKRTAAMDTNGNGQIDKEETYDPLKLYSTVTDPSSYSVTITANASGGSGNYSYRWATGESQDFLSYGSWTSMNQVFTTNPCPDGIKYYKCQVRDNETSLIVEKESAIYRTCDGNLEPLKPALE